MKTFNYLFTIVFFLFSIFLLPEIAEACGVCGADYPQRTVNVYRGITIFLTLMPMILGGSLFLWIYSHYKKR